MFILECREQFIGMKWRWAIIFTIIFLAVFIDVNIYPATNTWDVLVEVFTQNFLLCMVIFPILFLLLITDLITRDWKSGFVIFIASRMPSRLYWVLSKTGIILLTSFCFIAGIVIIAILVSLLHGVPLSWSWSEQRILLTPAPPFEVFYIILVVYWVTLSAFGTCIVFISMVIRNTVLSWGLGAVLSFFSFLSWWYFQFHFLFLWMPTAQLHFLAMYPNVLVEMFEGFSMKWSISYNAILFAVSFIGMWLIIRKVDISGERI